MVEDDRSTLSVEASEEGNWLVYTSTTPATVLHLEIRAVSSCLALAQLALLPHPEQDLVTRETQVRIDSNGPWLTVLGAQLSRRASRVSPVRLISAPSQAHRASCSVC